MNNRPLIVISNDDGIQAAGLKNLVNVASKYADIIAIAPDSERSGQSHSVTVLTPLKIKQISAEDGIKYYSCNGTPVDCVKLGIKVLSDRVPDLVLAGINHGSNIGTNVFYSGTLGIATEAAFEKIPAIGFSLCCYSSNADFSDTLPFIDDIINKVLHAQNLPKQFCLSVNFPYKPDGGIKGIKICAMSEGMWNETYVERIIPSTKKPYYWVTGCYVDETPSPNTEQYLLNEGFASVIPVSIDITRYEIIDELKGILKLTDK